MRRLRLCGRLLIQNLPPTQRFGFDSDGIIDRRPNPLLAAKVSLGRLNRDMSQQELDLLQFASGSMTQTSAGDVWCRHECQLNKHVDNPWLASGDFVRTDYVFPRRSVSH